MCPQRGGSAIKAESLSFFDNPLFDHATLYSRDGIGVLVIQQYWNANLKCTFWSFVEREWREALMEGLYFNKWFEETARPKPYPVVELRKALWAVGVRPGPKKEFWETRF